jgi:hypothetical protein
MAMLSCPRSSWTALSVTPVMRRCDAELCRRPCVVIRFPSPARRQVDGTTFLTIE